MKKSERSSENDNYLVIDKKAIENYFFISILCLSIIVFCVVLVKGVINIDKSNNVVIDSSLLSSYKDDNLNVLYPIPGGAWQLGKIDDTEITSIIEASKGEDGVFDIEVDPLTSEVLSSACFNEEGDVGFRQFMSFTFKPTTGFQENEFYDYCVESFKRDVTVNETVDYKEYKFLSAEADNEGGVLLKATLTQESVIEKEDGKTEKQEIVSYYTQYTMSLGANIMTVTFGSVFEDKTIDDYLKHFINNTVNQNSLNS